MLELLRKRRGHKQYCVNKNPHIYHHEVHVLDGSCQTLPNKENQVNLGRHPDCCSALKEATRRGFPQVDGCGNCCPDYNKLINAIKELENK